MTEDDTVERDCSRSFVEDRHHMVVEQSLVVVVMLHEQTVNCLLSAAVENMHCWLHSSDVLVFVGINSAVDHKILLVVEVAEENLLLVRMFVGDIDEQ